MWKKSLWIISVCSLFLVCPFPGSAAPAGGPQAELWKNESFVTTAQAIKAGDWEYVTPKEVAIVALYEMGRVYEMSRGVNKKVKKIEGRIEDEINRLYRFAWIGSVAIGGYLALQLILTLVLIVRVRR